MSLTTLFLLIALILFVIAAIPTQPSGRLIPAGLAFATASQLVGTVIG